MGGFGKAGGWIVVKGRSDCPGGRVAKEQGIAFHQNQKVNF